MVSFNFKSLFIVLIISGLTGCKFITPAEERPFKTSAQVEKSSFLKPDGSARTFLCGQAAINEVGVGAWFATHNFNKVFHCNVEFEITERELVGKLVNPSKPNDKNSWKPIISIPISSHFYLEKEKDSYGRETNRVVKNSTRSHFSARPYMDLDYKSIRILDWSLHLSPSWTTPSVFDIKDVEIDEEKNYFAFTASVSLSAQYYGSGQIDYRFNFLEFEHNPKFERTPYNNKNSKHLNVLHIMGEKLQGVYPVLYTAKWDLNKRHEICLFKVPEDKIPLVKESFNLWNEALIEIGALDEKSFKEGKKGFFINESKKLDYAFDLRCSTFSWVSDKEISVRSPLGLSVSHADVRNGEMLWGQAVIFGGIIDNYLKNSMPISDNENVSSRKIDISALFPDGFSSGNIDFNLPSDLYELGRINFNDKLNNFLEKEFTKSKIFPFDFNVKDFQTEILDAKFKASLINKQNNFIETKSSFIIGEFNRAINTKILDFNSNLDLYDPYKLMGLDTYNFSEKENLPDLNVSKIFEHNQILIDQDATLMDVLPSYREMVSKSSVDEVKAMKSFYKELVLHELGHFFGMGHNFKDNILPDPEKVPEYIFTDLKNKATAKSGYTNYTTLMGYRHPYATIATDPEDIKPGIHDKHVLRYLYNQEYPVYRKGDSKDDFKYFKLPYADGIIPSLTVDPKSGKTYELAYLPACNDIDATYSFDAKCSRHTYGYDAETIVESYLNSINDNIVQTLVSSTGYSGGNADLREYYLAQNSWRMLGRIRLFYDEMRRDFEEEIKTISSDEDALYDFAEACESDLENITNKKLYEIFKSNPEFKKICSVNAKVVRELTTLLSKPLMDYTKYDFKNRYSNLGSIIAGDADYDTSRVLGSWKILSNMPLKIAAIGNLVSPKPIGVFSGPWGGFYLSTLPGYQINMDAGYSYSTLYPKLFTSAISQAVGNNINLANISGDYSIIGNTVLSLGYFLNLDKMSNDARKFNQNFIANIRNQQSFNFSVVAVILSKLPNPGKPDFVKKFTAQIFDFRSGQSINASEVYILPKGEILVRADKMFLYPFTKLKFLNDEMGLAFAYKLDYEIERGDRLSGSSVKQKLKIDHDRLLADCIVGKNGSDARNNGLETFFGTEKFDGFYVPKEIASNELKHDEFLASIEAGFKAYYNSDYGLAPDRNTCLEAKRGVGLIVSTASILNGYWLPETIDYINK